MTIWNNISDTVRGQPASHKMKREYVFSDHHTDILGTGGYSRVERVKSLKRNEYIAMKIVRKDVLSNKSAYIKLLARLHDMYVDLDSDYIVRCYEYFESLDRYYISFELAAGGDLFDYILHNGRYAENDAKGVMKRLLTALKFVHGYGLIHRDIKPENIFYRDSSNPLVCALADFGLALVLDKRGDDDSQRFYEVAGTPGYAAPEIYRRTGYGKKSDLFGLGVVCYMCLSSWSPWSSSDPRQLMTETLTTPVKFYASHFEGVSEQAKDFISGLTEKNPDRRMSIVEALEHPWLNSVTDEKEKKSPLPVAQNLVRMPTARGAEYYEGCQLAKKLTRHAEEHAETGEVH